MFFGIDMFDKGPELVFATELLNKGMCVGLEADKAIVFKDPEEVGRVERVESVAPLDLILFFKPDVNPKEERDALGFEHELEFELTDVILLEGLKGAVAQEELFELFAL